MENITEVEIETLNGIEKHIIIDRGNGEFTSMSKEHWDKLEAAKEAQSL